MLDGYEDMPDDVKEKIAAAFKAGHVADEDWKGVSNPLLYPVLGTFPNDFMQDVEMNRPGKTGFKVKTPKAKKSKKSADQVSSLPSFHMTLANMI